MFQGNDSSDLVGLPLSVSLFSRLREDILQEKLKAGERLTEQQICDSYAVSRTPVREAFRQLERDGLIRTVPNRGAFIVGITKEDIRDMYELRKAFETVAIHWAIMRITKEEFLALQEAYEFMEFYTLKKDVEKMLHINMHFHELIYNAAHNHMLSHTLSTYQFYIKATKTNRTYVDGYLEEVLAEHKTILQAFCDRDPQAGVSAITKHLENAKKRAKIAD